MYQISFRMSKSHFHPLQFIETGYFTRSQSALCFVALVTRIALQKPVPRNNPNRYRSSRVLSPVPGPRADPRGTKCSLPVISRWSPEAGELGKGRDARSRTAGNLSSPRVMVGVDVISGNPGRPWTIRTQSALSGPTDPAPESCLSTQDKRPAPLELLVHDLFVPAFYQVLVSQFVLGHRLQQIPNLSRTLRCQVPVEFIGLLFLLGGKNAHILER